MLNAVVLMGRLTADPELRHTPANVPVTTFSLAVDRRYKSGTEKLTDFIDIVAWRTTAEFVSRYFTRDSWSRCRARFRCAHTPTRKA